MKELFRWIRDMVVARRARRAAAAEWHEVYLIVSEPSYMKPFLDNASFFERRHPEEFRRCAHSLTIQLADPSAFSRIGEYFTTTNLVIPPYTLSHIKVHTVTSNPSRYVSDTYDSGGSQVRLDITYWCQILIGEPGSNVFTHLQLLSPATQQQVLQDLMNKLLPLKRLVDADIVASVAEEQQRAQAETERQMRAAERQRLESMALQQRQQCERDRLAQDIIRRHQPPPGE